LFIRWECGASVALDDKYDGLQRLVQMGKDKGYVLYDEVSEVLPGDLAGGSDIDDVLAGLFDLLFEILGLFKNLDARDIEPGEHVIDIRAACKIAGQDFADLVVQDVAFILAHLYEPLQPVVFIF